MKKKISVCWISFFVHSWLKWIISLTTIVSKKSMLTTSLKRIKISQTRIHTSIKDINIGLYIFFIFLQCVYCLVEFIKLLFQLQITRVLSETAAKYGFCTVAVSIREETLPVGMASSEFHSARRKRSRQSFDWLGIYLSPPHKAECGTRLIFSVRCSVVIGSGNNSP